MANKNIERKLRFLPYLPYGYCGKTATTLIGLLNETARQFYVGEDPAETEKENKKTRQKARRAAKSLIERKYATDTNLTCGTPPTKRSFRRLTKAGLAVLVEAIDEAMVDKDEEYDITELQNKTHYRSKTTNADELREMLNGYAHDSSELGQLMFDEMVYDAVISRHATPMTYAAGLIANAKVSTGKYSPNQLYNIWRLSHINAMFAANGFLTYVDRRPYDTGFRIDGIYDRESYEAYVKKHGLTVAAITYYALTNWYAKHPEFCRFCQTTPDTSEKGKNKWLNTPAFYAAGELPEKDDDNNSNATGNYGSKQVAKTIHVGLAIGRTSNFACYHCKTGEFKWYAQREAKTKAILEKAVRNMKTQNPAIPCRDTVDFALLFCTNRHQFEALFERTRKKHIPNKKLPLATKDPYASIHIVPVNDSGICELSLLMDYGPAMAQSTIINHILSIDPDFKYNQSVCYPLTYDDVPVFVGYTMDLFTIHHALEDHLDGRDFYIACFPEQAPLYRSLFPGHLVL